MLKAVAQGALAALPARTHLNYLAQRYLTRSLETGKKAVHRRLVWAGKHLTYFSGHTGRDLPAHVLELGTGWFPTVPFGLWLSGVDATTTIDIVDLKRADYFRALLPVFLTYSRDELIEVLPRLQPDRYDHLRDVAARVDRLTIPDLLDTLRVRTIIGDAAQTDFDPAAFDLIISNTTFEHIPRPILATILREFARVIAPDGVMSHLIDLSDHYSHFDQAITPYNYLRYDESAWRWFNNAALYQNRLRVNDYRDLHSEAGFTLFEEANTTTHAADLEHIPLARPFQHYTRDDLLPTRSWMVSKTNRSE